ncbi:MAG TPA: hypothetical protein VHH88_13250, partial [Verrucomicrobiae bacterium]|nr:hypothetical protein [Verrucomicrobiae bacterium]
MGPIGLETLKLAAEKPWVEITGAIDIDPQKAGADLGALTRIKSLKGKRVYKSLDEMPARQKPRLIFHTAVSRLQLA